MDILALTISAVGWTALTALGGIVEGKSDYALNRVAKRLLDNFRGNRLEENHELQRAVYRAYLQATLQACALRAGGLGINVDKLIPSRSDPPMGLFEAEEAKWLIQVIGELRERIKWLEKGQIAPPSRGANDELSLLTDQLHLLLEPRGEAALNRIGEIRNAACERVIEDLDGDYRKRYGPVPDGLSRLIRQCWFEMMCGFFQSAIKYTGN